MSLLRSFLYRIRTQESRRFLGRWNLEYCGQALTHKITQTNEDHCGSCGSTPIQRRLERQEKEDVNRQKMQVWVQSVKRIE
jgi:hypothetical protein